MNTIMTIPKKLSPRELQIVELSMEGSTNEEIAYRLGLSVGTVNTYWMRIRLKVGGVGRTDSVAKILAFQNEQERNLKEREKRERQFHEKMVEIASMALIKSIASICQVAAWAVDMNLIVQIAGVGQEPSKHVGNLQNGNSICDIFRIADPDHLVISAQLDALSGKESEVQLVGKLRKMTLHSVPIRDAENKVLGCLGILSIRASSLSFTHN